MKLVLSKAEFYIFLLVLALSSACQGINSEPAITVQPTGVVTTPTIVEIEIKKTFTPLPTEKTLPTQTIEPQFLAEPGKFNGLGIDFWHPWSGETADRVVSLVEEFNRTNIWGIKVNVISYYSAGALFDAVQNELTHGPGNLPQVIAAPDDQFGIWAENGILIPLDDYIHLEDFGLLEQGGGSYYPIFWQQNLIDDQQIGIPILRSANVLFYNRTWARELGFPTPPKTPYEFKEQACTAAVANNTSKIIEKFGTGGWLVDTDSLTILSWLDAFNAHPLPSGDSPVYSFASQESQQALVYLREMLDDGCAWLWRSQTPDDFFTRRLALFYTGNLQDVWIQKRLSELSGNQDEWILIPYPREDGSGIIYSYGYSLAITVGSSQNSGVEHLDQKMASWLFIRWMSQPEKQVELAVHFPSLPVSTAVTDILGREKEKFPWVVVLPILEFAQPAPANASWRSVRRLVEDTGWQVFHLPEDQVNTILPQLDAGIKEILR